MSYNLILHLLLLQKEWLCLNCQTQRALLGQLGDSKNVPQSSPVAAKLETQATPATEKAEPKTAPTKADITTAPRKSQHTSASMKVIPAVPTPEPIMKPVQAEPTTATATSTQINLETTISKVAPVTEEKLLLAAEHSVPTLATVQQTLVTPKAEIPNTEVSKTVTVEISEDAVIELPRAEDFANVKAEVSTVPVTKATAVPISCIAADVTVDTVITETETKPEIHLTEPTKSLPQAEVPPKSQEPQPGSVIEADIKEVADKLVEKIIGVSSPLEKQLVSTKDIDIKVRMGPLY